MKSLVFFKPRLHCPTVELSLVELSSVVQRSQGYDCSCGHFLRLDSLVVDLRNVEDLRLDSRSFLLYLPHKTYSIGYTEYQIFE